MQILLAQFWTYCCTWARNLFGDPTRSVTREIVMWPSTWLIFNLSTRTREFKFAPSYESDLHYLPFKFLVNLKYGDFQFNSCFNSYFNLYYYYYSRSIIPPFFRYYVWLELEISCLPSQAQWAFIIYGRYLQYHYHLFKFFWWLTHICALS